MLVINILRYFAISVLLLYGCGGGTSGTGPLSGVFIDAPVQGISYTTTSGVRGTTDVDGRFYYDPGDEVEFSIGSLKLGKSRGKSQVTPVDIIPGGNINDPRVINILILLQSLDEDGDPNNGIKINDITATVVAANAGNINFNQSSSDFSSDAKISALMNTLNATSGAFTDISYRGKRVLRSAAAALSHFQNVTSERIVVNTTHGKVSGFSLNENTWQWRGIPYAKPPVGELRWKPPQDLAPWTGVRDATTYGPWAPQTFPTAAWTGNIPESEMSEDCLYINITAPKNASNLPVLVWLHGGGLNASSANMSSYNTPYLSQRGAVVVTVNQRLGPIGYFAHQWLREESSYGGSGNYGQMDIIAALKWIKNNISVFGGDPNRVVVFGQSGGGARTLFTIATPLAKNLLSGAIIEAGIGAGTGGGSHASYIFNTVELAEANGKKLTDALGVKSLKELRSKKWQEIITTANSCGFESRWSIDGYSLPDTIWNIFGRGEQNKMPIIIGAGEGEPLKHNGTYEWAQRLMGGGNLFVYVFSQVPSNWKSFIKAYHGLEVAYHFGVLSSIAGHRNVLFAAPSGLPTDPGIDEKDEYISDIMMKMWVQFAKTGNPSISGVIIWPSFGTGVGEDKYLNIIYPLEIKSNFMVTYKYP